MDLGPLLIWLKFIHVLAALALVLAHGASAAVAFKLRRERDRVAAREEHGVRREIERVAVPLHDVERRPASRQERVAAAVLREVDGRRTQLGPRGPMGAPAKQVRQELGAEADPEERDVPVRGAPDGLLGDTLGLKDRVSRGAGCAQAASAMEGMPTVNSRSVPFASQSWRMKGSISAGMLSFIGGSMRERWWVGRASLARRSVQAVGPRRHQEDKTEHPAGFCGYGYRDRGDDGDRSCPRRRDRCYPPQHDPRARTAGSPVRQAC